MTKIGDPGGCCCDPPTCCAFVYASCCPVPDTTVTLTNAATGATIANYRMTHPANSGYLGAGGLAKCVGISGLVAGEVVNWSIAPDGWPAMTGSITVPSTLAFNVSAFYRPCDYLPATLTLTDPLSNTISLTLNAGNCDWSGSHLYTWTAPGPGGVGTVTKTSTVGYWFNYDNCRHYPYAGCSPIPPCDLILQYPTTADGNYLVGDSDPGAVQSIIALGFDGTYPNNITFNTAVSQVCSPLYYKAWNVECARVFSGGGFGHTPLYVSGCQNPFAAWLLFANRTPLGGPPADHCPSAVWHISP